MGRGWKPGVEFENVMSLSRIEGHSTLLMLASEWMAASRASVSLHCPGISAAQRQRLADVDSQQKVVLTIASHDAL